MPYTKTTWVEGGEPAITAQKLNNLETQYEKVMTDVNTMTAVNNGTTPGESSYPVGITQFQAGIATGYPEQYGTVVNFKVTTGRFTQFFFGTGASAQAKDNGMWFRHYYTGVGWTQWFKVSTNDPDAHFEAVKSQQTFTANGSAIISGFTEREDRKGNFNNTTGQFTAPVSGMYLFQFEASTTIPVPSVGGIALEKNGSGTTFKNLVSTGYSGHLQASKAFYLNVGDVIRLRVTGNASGNIDDISYAVTKI